MKTKPTRATHQQKAPNSSSDRRATSHEGATLADAHVNFHSCFDSGVFFDAADQNITSAATRLEADVQTIGCLCFTECTGVNEFARLAETQKNLAQE